MCTFSAALLMLSPVLAVASGQERSAAATSQQLDRQLQAASAEYESGHFSEAASHLESLLRQVPDSFEVHELLGLVYSAQSQERAAKEHFERAVQLKPDSGVARTNLATNLVRLGMYGPAEEQFKQAVKLEPQSFDANHNLGEFYIQSGKISEAAPFLERAQKINPASYDNGYDLSLAYAEIGRLSDARQLVAQPLEEEKYGRATQPACANRRKGRKICRRSQPI